MNDKRLIECFKILSSEARDFYLRNDVTVVEHQLSALEFYRDWVSTNIPVVMKGAIKHWPALTKWSNTYLRSKMGSKLVKVAATPNGYADAIAKGYFVMPEELEMTVGNFLSVLENPDSLQETVLFSASFSATAWCQLHILIKIILLHISISWLNTSIYHANYVQSQNGNLNDEWADLLEDCGNDLQWATEAFGEPPTAANFWMGDQRAVTSMHRDPFENIYCVVRGYKDFILHPPTDLPWIPYTTLPVAKYQSDQNCKSSPKYKIIPLTNASRTEMSMSNVNSEEIEENLHPAEKICDKKMYDNGKRGNCSFKDPITSDLEKDCDNEIGNFELVNSEEVKETKQTASLSISEEFENNEPLESLSISHVPWICIDPENPDFETYPLYAHATQVKVRVHAGDVLFLPAYWFHHVRQSHACIAVNYWYDVRFDHRHAYQALITALLRNSDLNTGCPPHF